MDLRYAAGQRICLLFAADKNRNIRKRAQKGSYRRAGQIGDQMTAGIGGAGEGMAQSNGGRGGNKQGLIAAMGDGRGEGELFQRVRARLRAQVGEDIFNSWFARLELEEIVDGKVHLSVPTRFLCSWILSNYADKILDVFKTEIPDVTRLHLTVRVNGQPIKKLEKPAEITAEPES